MQTLTIDKVSRKKAITAFACMSIANVFVNTFALLHFSSFLSYAFENYDVYQRINALNAYSPYVKFAALFFGAYFIQKLYYKTGKITPFYGKFRWVIVVVSVGCFVNVSSLGTTLPMIYYTAVWYVHQACTGILGVIQSAMFLIIAGSDMNDRISATTKLVIYGVATSFISTICINNASLLLYNGEHVFLTGYLIMAAVFGAVFMILSSLIIKAVKPVEEFSASLPRKAEAESSVGEMIRDLFTSKPYAAYWIRSLTSLIASSLTTTMVFYYIQATIGFEYYSIASTVSTLFNAFAVPVFALAGRKFFGKKNALYIASFAEVIVRLLSFVALKVNVWAFIVTNGFAVAFAGIGKAYGLNYIADSAEQSLRRKGKDSRIFMMAMISSSTLLLNPIINPLRDLMMKFVRYDRLREYTLMGLDIPAELWAEVGGKFHVSMSIIPALVALIGALAVFFLYKISDEEAVENLAENEEYLRTA